MTSPGGGGNNINLAALWIPVMPETSHIGDEMAKAGSVAKKKFEEGFNSTGSSPEALGSSFGSKVSQSISKEFGNLELPFGMSKALEKFGGDVDKNVVNKLKGEASQALQQYRAEYDKLTEATNRVAEAERKYNAGQEAHVGASTSIPLLREKIQATNGLKEAQSSAGSAYENLTSKSSALTDEMGKGATSSNIMAGIMGGAVVAGAQLAANAVEKFVDLIKEGLKVGVESVEEFSEKMIDVGETLEHVNVQVEEFASGTSAHMEELAAHAQSVFTSLDVAGADTGKTMAQFSSMLNAEPGAALDNLTRNVTELQGRFTGLKSQDVAAVFNDFKLPMSEADSALASMLQNARNSGQDLGVLTQSLSGLAGSTLHEAGLNIGQASAFMGDLMKKGEPGRQVMTGMSSAMKEFTKRNLSFSDGMKMTATRLQELGDTAEGQGLAEKLFGTRNWIVAQQGVQDYLDIVNKGPDAFNASGDSIGEFLDKTKTLENEWAEVKHKFEEAFAPVGMVAIKAMGDGLNSAVGYVKDHMDEIHHAITQGGLYFIEFAAQTQTLVIGLLEFFAPIVNAIDSTMGSAIATLGSFSHVAGEVLSNIPGFTDIGNGLIDAGKAAEGFGMGLQHINVGQTMKDLAEWNKQHKIDVKEWGDEWIKSSDKVVQALNSATDATDAAKWPWMGAGNPPGADSNPAPGSPMGAPPAGTTSAPNPLAPTDTGGAPPMYQDSAGKWHASDPWWEGVIQAESGGNVAPTTNPNHFGLFQFSQSTWDGIARQQNPAWVGKNPGTAPAEIQAQMAQQNYNQNKGNLPGQWANPFVAAHPNGTSGIVSGFPTSGNGDGPGDAPIGPTPGAPGMGGGSLNLSTIAVAAQKYAGDCIDASARIILSHSGVNLSEDQLENVISPGTNIDVLAAGLNKLDPQGNYKSMPGSGGSPQALQAAIEASIKNGTGSILNVAPGSSIAGHTFAPGHFIAATGYNPDGSINLSDTAGGKQYAVSAQDAFQATQGRGIVAGTGVGPSAQRGLAFPLTGNGAGDGSTSPGKNGGYQGLPGQYGGNGAYGGETTDEQYQTAQAVQSARDRQDDLAHTVDVNQRRVDDLTAKLNAPPAKSDIDELTGLPDPKAVEAEADKHKKLQEELDDATHTLAVSRRDASEQTGKVSEAERKQQEAVYKKPKGAGQSEDGKLGQTLGSGLLAGIGQELGVGGIFAKSPLDWGIVKLAEGLFNYGNSLGDAVFGKSAPGAGPGGNQGVAGGLGTGLIGSLGLKSLISPISASPNIIPGTPPGQIGVQGAGPLPGPPVINNDNSIHVSSDVSDRAVMAPVQAQQNSSNAKSFGNSGGFPAP